MGEPSPNPALATLAKEKKPKKKKAKDKEQPPVPTSHQQQQQQQPQQPPQQLQQAKGPLHKDLAFIKQEDGGLAPLKPESRSVIKTVPSPLKPAAEGSDPRLRDPASLPPELSKQQPVGTQGTQAARGEGKSDSPSKSSNDQRLARPPSSLSINSPLQVSTENREHSGDVQSPAYSDISDESAPTLENETQPKQKEDGEKSGPTDGKNGDRPPEHSMAAYGMYHGYYGQPPYLIPAVPTNNPSQAAAAAAAPAAAAAGPRQTPPIKPSEKELDLSSKPDPTLRNKEGERDSNNVDKSKDGSTSTSKQNSDDVNKGASSNGQQLSDYQLQQQKLMQQQQMYQYYGGYVDPNYMRIMNDYGSQQDKLAEDQDRKGKEATTVEQCKDSPGASKRTDSPKSKSEGRPSSRSTPNTPHNSQSQSHSQPSTPQYSQSAKQSSQAERAGDKAAPPTKPPALISEKERKMREMEQRASVSDASLKEKQNENHQILKENIALKNQMDIRHNKQSRMEYNQQQYDNNMLIDRQRDELQRYYLYQEQQRMLEQHRIEEERRRYFEHYAAIMSQAAASGSAIPHPFVPK